MARGPRWLARVAERRWATRTERTVRQAWLRVIVATANVGRKSNPVQRRVYLEQLQADLPRGRDLTILFFQEIDEADAGNEHRMIRQVFTPERGWHTSAMTTMEPIVWRDGDRTWARAAPATIERAMGGIRRQSPARKASTTVLEETSDGDGLVAAVGGHDPAGAFNGHRAPKTRALLRRGWRQAYRATRQAIRTARRAEADVFAAKDTNRHNGPKWHPREVLATARRLIDRVAAIPGRGRRARVVDTGELHNPTEALHPCRWAEYDIRPKKETR